MAQYIDVLNPATGSSIGKVDNASVADCLRAVDVAADAFASWKATAPRARAEILRKAFEIMIAEQESLARTITLEMGKVLSDARAEVAYAAEFFRWFSEEAVRIDGDYRRAPSGANWLLVSRQPVGVALLATPWNFPAAMATRKIAPALAAGCTVVLKPAHDTPLTALAIADILHRAGAPEGVVNVVVADPPGPAVEAMLDSGKIRKLSFTGSTRVGSLLLAQAAKRIINCSMELGGNAPFIVFDDADIDLAVEGAMLAKMRNGGAACTAANRFYIHNSVLAEFTDKFTARMAALTLGDGLDPSTTLGPLVSRAQQERVTAAVGAAVSRGAKVLCGGAASTIPAFGYEATVLANVSPTDEILQDEIFGPVASLVSFSDDTEMMRQANDVEHGLVSYVFTRDAARGMRTAELLETGMVGFNRGLVSDPAAPFGGVKASGIGREGGHDGLLAFLETKYVAGNW
ncbi:MAG: NAD-dependent succinate-semialdehyde dehydrogenase [Actinobacteria bacterium]|nr:NAD-dependent succinate-semialdehyde dehydrogenase [Actinomycetota bacterium]MDA2951695.1 NAD-dependent succinate-semialdehyde dehydrogenase [Actinomycetota bacterium]